MDMNFLVPLHEHNLFVSLFGNMRLGRQLTRDKFNLSQFVSPLTLFIHEILSITINYKFVFIELFIYYCNKIRMFLIHSQNYSSHPN